MLFLRVLLPMSLAFLLALPATVKAGELLVPHRALYDIELVATHSGSQILNISGQMAYEWKPVCDGWVTAHKFKLDYDYADSSGMKITSDFTTYETSDGNHINFTSRRLRGGDLYQEIRGWADKGKRKAVYSLPEPISYDLSESTLFPVGHTLELIKHALAGDKFYNAEIFDGSDEDGPIEINTFIGEKTDARKMIPENPKIKKSLINGTAWKVRMAVFPSKNPEEESDYEMSMVLHENGIISDMLIEYDDFSVRQRLIGLESLPADKCE